MSLLENNINLSNNEIELMKDFGVTVNRGDMPESFFSEEFLHDAYFFKKISCLSSVDELTRLDQCCSDASLHSSELFIRYHYWKCYGVDMIEIIDDVLDALDVDLTTPMILELIEVACLYQYHLQKRLADDEGLLNHIAFAIEENSRSDWHHRDSYQEILGDQFCHDTNSIPVFDYTCWFYSNQLDPKELDRLSWFIFERVSDQTENRMLPYQMHSLKRCADVYHMTRSALDMWMSLQDYSLSYIEELSVKMSMMIRQRTDVETFRRVICMSLNSVDENLDLLCRQYQQYLDETA